jgi:hypothetical protein
MEREPNNPLNTREFTARWHGIVEEHVVPNLAAVLPRLTSQAAGPITSDLWDGLARHLAHALQIASSPSGGVQGALDYLQQMAEAGPGKSP